MRRIDPIAAERRARDRSKLVFREGVLQVIVISMIK
jgi:hypothetical protein